MPKNRVWVFLLFTFGWSWSFWVAGILSMKQIPVDDAVSTFQEYYFLGLIGPSVSAIFCVLYYNGFSGFWRLIQKLFYYRAPTQNFLVIVIVPFLFLLLSVLLFKVFNDDPTANHAVDFATIPSVIWAIFLLGPLAEELGWRGFVLAEFQSRISTLSSALLVGIIWFTWQIPLLGAPIGTIISGTPLTFIDILAYLFLLICISFTLTWLINTARGSVLQAILFRSTMNLSLILLFMQISSGNSTMPYILSVGFLVLFTVFLALVTDLGYEKSIHLISKKG